MSGKRGLNERQKNILRYLREHGPAETKDIADDCCDGGEASGKVDMRKLMHRRADSSLTCLENRGLVRSWRDDMKRNCPMTWELSEVGRAWFYEGRIDG